MYNTTRLTILRDLAEVGSATAVSERLGISPSAVSQHIKALENEMGATLVERHGRTLRLTPDGRVLVKHAGYILEAIDDARRALHDGPADLDRLRISAFHTVLTRVGGSLLEEIAIRRPNLVVNFIEESPEQATRSVRRGDSTLAVIHRTAGSDPAELAGVSNQVLYEDPVVILAPPRVHERVREVGIAALRTEDWVTGTHEGPALRALVASCEALGFTPNLVHRVRTFTSQVSLVTAGVGLGAVPRTSVPESAAGLIVLELRQGMRTVEAIHLPGAENDPVIADALDVLVTATREMSQMWH